MGLHRKSGVLSELPRPGGEHPLPPEAEAAPPEDTPDVRVFPPAFLLSKAHLLVAKSEKNKDFLIIPSREFINSNEYNGCHPKGFTLLPTILSGGSIIFPILHM